MIMRDPPTPVAPSHHQRRWAMFRCRIPTRQPIIRNHIRRIGRQEINFSILERQRIPRCSRRKSRLILTHDSLWSPNDPFLTDKSRIVCIIGYESGKIATIPRCR